MSDDGAVKTSGSGGKKRIDLLLVEQGWFPSREQAQRAVMAGHVFYDGRLIDKAGAAVAPGGEIEVRGDPCPYVSRGGIKLESALREFGIDVAGKVALDAGASTGGFTQCLLQRGVSRVYAVDVGYGQLAWELRRDERVRVIERTNLRYLTPEVLGERVEFVTLDLSFISLAKVLGAVRELLRPGGEVLSLVKPQFEAGREQVGKGGIVKEAAVQKAVLEQVSVAACQLGFQIKGVTYSTIPGADGNIEFFMWLGCDPQAVRGDALSPEQAEQVVVAARANLSPASRSAPHEYG
jgi:23S rRNA (cytidine1920-2'-O)/16S rRNA (cytidine1409-2'-O)-methyltransferase